jgi:hypothetical protein
MILTTISKSSGKKPGRSDLDESIRTHDQRRILAGRSFPFRFALEEPLIDYKGWEKP